MYLNLLSYFLFFVMLSTFKETPVIELNTRSRSVASESPVCSELLASFFKSKNRSYKKWDHEAFLKLKSEYSDLPETELTRRLNQDQRVEHLMAIIETLGKRYDSKHSEVHSIGLFQRKSLHKMQRKWSKKKRFSQKDMSDFSEEIYQNLYKEKTYFRDLFNQKKMDKIYLRRIIHQDILKYRLADFAKIYNIPGAKKGQLKSFLESKIGQRLLDGLFSLPVVFGYPPLGLPGLSRLNLSKEMIEKILKDGLNKKNLVSAEKELSQKMSRNFLQTMGARARYELLKNYYSISIVAILTFYSFYEYYWDHQKTEEQLSVLDKFIDQGNSYFQSSFFQDDSDREGSYQCGQINSCLLKMGGHLDFKKSDFLYLKCKRFMDPDDFCKR